jgi:hypothetical protein
MKNMRFGLGALLVCLVSAQGQSPDQKNATVRYLQALQTGDGGFLASAPDPRGQRLSRPSLRATTSALRALKYFGGEVKNKEACVKFLNQCFDKDTSYFADSTNGKPDIITTAIGIMAIAELKLSADKVVNKAVQCLLDKAQAFEEIRMAAAALEAIDKRPEGTKVWLGTIARMRNPDGTYGKDKGQARDTGGAVVTVLRLGGKVGDRDTVIKVLQAGQRGDGGFGKADAVGSDLESTYRVMRALVMLKNKPHDVAKLKTFIDKCRNADGGYSVAPGQESSTSGTYFAGILLHWLNKE